MKYAAARLHQSSFEDKYVVMADLFLCLDVSAIECSDGQGPLNYIFIFPVPEASVPASDICLLALLLIG